MKPVDRIYWTRAFLAVAAGVLSTYFTLYTSLGIPTAVIAPAAVYALSYLAARFGLASNFTGTQTRSWYMKGIGTFIIMWLWMWILLYTVLR